MKKVIISLAVIMAAVSCSTSNPFLSEWDTPYGIPDFTKIQEKHYIPAIEAGLRLLKPGGIMSLCIYYGGESGYEERDALLSYLSGIDNKQYTVIVNTFHNRTGDPPIPVFLYKEI
jgi:hypothetical protein